MKQHRVFIAINPPEQFKKQIKKIQGEFSNLPMRWVKPENIHITLVFMGYIDDEEILNICKSLTKELDTEEIFNIKFNSIKLGPNEKSPRLIWIEGNENEELARLKTKIENVILKSGSSYKTEYKKFKPHITIGRIKQKEWNKNFKGFKINKKIIIGFQAEGVEIMESSISKLGVEYNILEKIELK